MRPLTSSGGFSMLEMLVALAILAGLTVVVTGTIATRPPIETGVGELLRLVANARSAVVLSGEAAVIVIVPGVVTYRDTRSSWGGILKVGDREVPDYHLLVNPDGSFSGERLSIKTAQGEVPIPGLYRIGNEP